MESECTQYGFCGQASGLKKKHLWSRAGRAGASVLFWGALSDEDRPPWSENDDVDPPRRSAWGLEARQRGVAPWPSLLFLSFFLLLLVFTSPCAFLISLALPLYIRSISLTSLPWSISYNPLKFSLSHNSPLFSNRSQLVFISSSAMGRSKSLFLSLFEDFANLMQFCFLFWYRGVCLFEATVLATDFC